MATKPDPKTGQELRAFFIELLEDKKLQAYTKNRTNYINTRRRRRGKGRLGPEAARLLQSDDLKDLEAHIGAITGSSKAVPMFVVCPPM